MKKKSERYLLEVGWEQSQLYADIVQGALLHLNQAAKVPILNKLKGFQASKLHFILSHTTDGRKMQGPRVIIARGHKGAEIRINKIMATIKSGNMMTQLVFVSLHIDLVIF